MILADATGSTDLGFGQPVSASRLIPFEIGNLESPIDNGELHLEILRGSTWMKAQLVQQNATGAVRLVFPDKREEVVDLATEEYRWLS